MKQEILTPQQFKELDPKLFLGQFQIYTYLYEQYLLERKLNEQYFAKLKANPTFIKNLDPMVTYDPVRDPFPEPTPAPLLAQMKLPPHYPNIPEPSNSTLDFHKCKLWEDSTGHCGKCGTKL